jgi:hypothetical protein
MKPNFLFSASTPHRGSGPVSENREQPEIRLIFRLRVLRSGVNVSFVA